VKKAILALGLASLAAVGCSSSKKSYTNVPSESVMDVKAPAPAPAPVPQPVVQPVVSDTMTTQPPTASLASSGSYTVRKGDTLYAIAKNKYGDGKQWTRIASANPGLRPEALKAGQTIVVP
jgi:5'-nucleotidase